MDENLRFQLTDLYLSIEPLPERRSFIEDLAELAATFAALVVTEEARSN